MANSNGMSSDRSPLVSVVIPHKGPDAGLNQCLAALRNQTFGESKVEVLVVLNEPKDRRESMNIDPRISLLWQPFGGVYSARNVGLLAARANILAFTDSDTIPTPYWIEAGLQCLEKGATLVAGNILVTSRFSPPTPSACYEMLFSFDQEKYARFGQSTTANLFVSSAVFLRHGLFSGDAYTGEDFDWTDRVTRAGETMVFCPVATVFHPARESMSDLVAKAKRDSFPPELHGGWLSLLSYGLRRWSRRFAVPPSAKRIRRVGMKGTALALCVAASLQGIKGYLYLRAMIRRINV